VQPIPLDITESMDTLAISPTKTKRDEHRRRPPAHEMTLPSLSTESSNILNRLLQPEDTRDRDAFSFEDGKSRFREGRIMPGTLIVPTPSFFTETPPVIETVQSNGPRHSDSKASVVVPPPPPPPMGASALPLARSMSVEERMTFLDGLAEVSRGPPATVYSIHIHELHHVAESARKCGFHTGTVFHKTGTMEEGLLILGRDLRAVEDLLAKLSRETPKQSGIRAVAGGAVAGAVATFTGLALA